MLRFRRWLVRFAGIQAACRFMRPEFTALRVVIAGCFVAQLVVPALWMLGNKHLPWGLFQLLEAVLFTLIVAALAQSAARISAETLSTSSLTATSVPQTDTSSEPTSPASTALSPSLHPGEGESAMEATEGGTTQDTFDVITGLLNDRGLLERLYAEVQGSITYDLPLSVALIDLAPAWTWCGEETSLAGMDRVMERVARVLQEQMAKTDVAARYGPDRFCVILAQTDMEAAQARVRKWCHLLANDSLLQGYPVSAGVASRSKTLSGPAALLSAALATMERYREARRGGIEALERGPGPDLTVARTYDAVVETWAFLTDLKDKDMQGHTTRVTEMTVTLARAVGMSRQETTYARWGALLHDVGKIAIPENILNKPDRLTEEEIVIMQKHPGLAYEFLGRVPFLLPALDIPYCHHEKWDGTGYPRGLKGEEIPLSARLFAIVDVYDALCSDRPYRKGWEPHKVMAYVRQQAGAHFDPWAVEAFNDMMRLRAAA